RSPDWDSSASWWAKPSRRSSPFARQRLRRKSKAKASAMVKPVSRCLLKLSGEALAGQAEFGIDPDVIRRIGREIVAAQRSHRIEYGVVLGGGNFFRGPALERAGLARVTGDHMGMLATVMNALAFRDVLRSLGARALVLSAIPMAGMVEGYSQPRALDLLQSGHVVIFAGGTGNP